MRFPWEAGLALILIACTATPRSFEIELTYSDALSPLRFEIDIHAGEECEGTPAHTFNLTSPNMPDLDLAPGQYCIAVRGFDGSCAKVLEATEEITLPVEEDIEIELVTVVGAMTMCPFEFCDETATCCCEQGLDCGDNCCPGQLPCANDACGDIMITGGSGHTCVLALGEVQCWGDNLNGQTGAETRATRQPPNTVLDDARYLASGERHACAITEADQVICWGNNPAGQLGENASGDPMALPIEDALMVTAGLNHTCVVTNGGTAQCWGANVNGQLGNGTTEPPSGPADFLVTGMILELAAGELHTCALYTDAGSVRRVGCVGSNDLGQLGEAVGAGTHTSLTTVALQEPQAIRSGKRHACAIDLIAGQRRLLCWGENTSGQLGVGDMMNHDTPIMVDLASPVEDVALGADFTCARLQGNIVSCWGSNLQMQVPGSGVSFQPAPRPVDQANPAFRIGTGHQHACTLNDQGRLLCWGANASGQIDWISTDTSIGSLRAVGVVPFSYGANACE